MASPKEANKTPTTNPKENEMYKLSVKEFRIILLKKSREVEEKKDRQV